jgi:cytidylate kinase
MLSVLKEGMKIGVVGKSGSGKSLDVDILAFALGCSKQGSGDHMRELAKLRGFDVETFSKLMTPADDKLVDQCALDFLSDPSWTGIIHGRTIRLLAEGLINDGVLDSDDYLNIAVECSPLVRAERGLAKFRKKPGKENATVDDVMWAQAQRDANDFARIRPQFERSHGLHRQGQLYGAQGTNTRGIEHNSEFMTPRQELVLTLGVLYNLGKVTLPGYLLAFTRGCIKARLMGF